MKYWNKIKERPGLVARVLVVILGFCELLYGWGQGTIDAIDFSADQVDYVRLYCAQLSFDGVAEVRDPEEIQTLIDSANALRNSGFDLKGIFQFGLGMGGSMLHEYDFFLKNGDHFVIIFSSNDGERPISDMELDYWSILPNGERISGSACHGSMEAFYELHQKYLPN